MQDVASEGTRDSDGAARYTLAMVRARIKWAQNFLTDAALAERLVNVAAIGASDLVYEIGPGEGILTRALARHARKVIAVDVDGELARRLKKEFQGESHVEIRHEDFLEHRFESERYRVFSNIPFNITADVVRKLLTERYPPVDAHLILQKEAAGKFAGQPRETEMSVSWKPWFDFSIVWEFRRTDFDPVPSVDVVMLRICHREKPLVSEDMAAQYRKFIRFAFRAWKNNLKSTFKAIFTYEQWKRLSRDHGFPLKATPTELTFEQWLRIFQYFIIGTTEAKKRLIA